MEQIKTLSIQTIAPCMDSISEKMNIARKAAGFSYERLANATGVPLSFVNNFFAGKTSRPVLDNIAAICLLLNLSLDELLGLTSTNSTQDAVLKNRIRELEYICKCQNAEIQKLENMKQQVLKAVYM